MKRIILSMLLWVIAAVAYPQLGGRLGKVVDKGVERADIIQIDFASLDTETGQEYINCIKESVYKNEMQTKSNNPKELEKSLEEIDGNSIIIWKCYTSKGVKKLHKTISRLVPKTRLGMGWSLYLWKKGCGKYPRMSKSIGMHDNDFIMRYNHTIYDYNKIGRLAVTALDKTENRLIVMYYIGTTLVYWSNK